jgi:hypothetical protein
MAWQDISTAPTNKPIYGGANGTDPWVVVTEWRVDQWVNLCTTEEEEVFPEQWQDLPDIPANEPSAWNDISTATTDDSPFIIYSTINGICSCYTWDTSQPWPSDITHWSPFPPGP